MSCPYSTATPGSTPSCFDADTSPARARLLSELRGRVTIRVDDEVWAEVFAAASRYERERVSLGEEFVEAVDAALAAIAVHPEAWVVWPDIRQDDPPIRRYVMARCRTRSASRSRRPCLGRRDRVRRTPSGLLASERSRASARTRNSAGTPGCRISRGGPTTRRPCFRRAAAPARTRTRCRQADTRRRLIQRESGPTRPSQTPAADTSGATTRSRRGSPRPAPVAAGALPDRGRPPSGDHRVG